MKNNCYFAGGNTPNGFFSYYGEIINPKSADYIYTLKGGPGVGKSTFMKKIAKIFEEKGIKVSKYYCSSDPDSLDAIKIDKPNIIFADGTSPHIIDPSFPGCFDNIINLGEYFNTDILKSHKEDIIDTTKKISGYFTTAYKYLASVKPLYENLNSMYEKAVNKEKFNSLVKSLAKEITDTKTGNGFKEKKMFLSAITPKGTVNFLEKTVNSGTVYILDSQIGDLTHNLFLSLKDHFKVSGFECECYYCPIGPTNKLEHIYLPELDTWVVTSNEYHKFNKKGIKIDSTSVYNEELIDKDILEYDTKMINELIKRAVHCISKAKSTHDILESYYIKAMDYKKLNAFSNEFINKLCSYS